VDDEKLFNGGQPQNKTQTLMYLKRIEFQDEELLLPYGRNLSEIIE
jgi:hypothetical protein